jgi:transposase
MQYIKGTNRSQAVLFAETLDQIIDADNEVRLIDLFVESIKMEEYHFELHQNTEGRPAYDPKDLLKLFIYGYLNSIRSSRVLEKECKRNVEVMWLMKQLAPDHNTISNFRRDNGKAIRKVFRYTVSIAREFHLIGGKLIAGDSTKMRAQNSKKNNFNEKKIQLHLQYIDKKLEEYNSALAEADEDNKNKIQAHIEKQEGRRRFYHGLSDQLKQSGEVQISTSDPDSRQLITRNNITEVGYNIQTTVDEKHKLILDYKVTNTNDSKAMGGMLRRAKTILATSDFTALYDKGYHTGSELKSAVQAGIEVMVAIPDISSASMAPDPAYNVSEFRYDETSHSYTCPEGNSLTTNGRWYNKDRNAPGRKRTTPIRVQHFKTTACKLCPLINACTKNTRGRGRVIERSEFQSFVDQNKKNIEANPETYKKRQAIIEHTYGIIKRQWGFYFITTKRGIKRAAADVGLMLTCFNLRRLFNILDTGLLKEFLRKLAHYFFGILKRFEANTARIFFSGGNWPSYNAHFSVQ